MILVTGAGGFIGRRLVSQLHSHGLKVLPLHRAESAAVRVDRLEADLTRMDHISALRNVRPVPETVVHLAGHIEISLRPDEGGLSASPLPGKEDIGRIYSSNVMATANLLDFCLDLGVRHMVFASSQAVYGMPVSDVINEKVPCAPLEHYAASKVCCESLLQVGARQGMAVTVLRFPGVYSPERRNGIVYGFFRSAFSEKKIRVMANVPLPLDVIYIDDVVNGFEKAVLYGGNHFLCLNMGTGEPCSLDLLADAVAKLIPGCSVEHSQIPQPVVRLDSSLAYHILGWQAKPQSDRLRYMEEQLRYDLTGC